MGRAFPASFKRQYAPCWDVDDPRRRLKKTWASLRLRKQSPESTLEMGFNISNFGAELAEAAKHARY